MLKVTGAQNYVNLWLCFKVANYFIPIFPSLQKERGSSYSVKSSAEHSGTDSCPQMGSLFPLQSYHRVSLIKRREHFLHFYQLIRCEIPKRHWSLGHLKKSKVFLRL